MTDLVSLSTYLGHAPKPDWPPQPWQIDEWTVATDSRALVAVRGQRSCRRTAPEKVAARVRAWVVEPGVRIGTYAHEALRDFAGRVYACRHCQGATTVPCFECDGTGHTERGCEYCATSHECTCPECEEGRADCPHCEDARRPVPVAIGAHVYNALYLAKVLSLVPVGEVCVEEIQTKLMLRLTGDGWFAVVMALRPGSATPLRTLESRP